VARGIDFAVVAKYETPAVFIFVGRGDFDHEIRVGIRADDGQAAHGRRVPGVIAPGVRGLREADAGDDVPVAGFRDGFLVDEGELREIQGVDGDLDAAHGTGADSRDGDRGSVRLRGRVRGGRRQAEALGGVAFAAAAELGHGVGSGQGGDHEVDEFGLVGDGVEADA